MSNPTPPAFSRRRAVASRFLRRFRTSPLKTPALALVVFAAPVYFFAATLVLGVRAWRRGAGIGAKICVAFLTLPYWAAPSIRLWAPSALEVLRNFYASRRSRSISRR